MKITRFEGDDRRSAGWPWWTLVEAVIWIVGEEGYEAPADSMALNDGDDDWSARKWAAKELRTALAHGRVTAYGLRSHSEKPDRIEPVEWNTREVPISEFRGLKSWQYEPYGNVVVAKDEIRRLWPVSLASEPTRRGRREEFDWPRILQIAAEERRRAPSGRKLEQWVQARCEKELKVKPSLSAIRMHLKSAQ